METITEDLELQNVAENVDYSQNSHQDLTTFSSDVSICLENSEIEMTKRARAETFSPLSPEAAPVVLVWKDLDVKVKKHGKEKVLLNKISGAITGGFWAIMGASGGGKTTLLSTLSLRLNVPGVQITGSITLNGRPYNKETLKTVSAYVMQDDLLHPDLTVEQTLVCTARLRLPRHTSKSEIKERVDTVISLMGIGHCRAVVIGDTRRKGISGGERKRLCIAMELLNRPSLLFLDEPTSGLDSSTALSVCSFLKDIADRAICTVVCTIHQPQSKIFYLFDNLILMKKGEIVYQGGSRKSLSFFAAAGFPCPHGVNPADHLLDVLTSHLENTAEGVPDNKVEVDIQRGADKPDFGARDIQSWPEQVFILLQRNAQQSLRRSDILIMNMLVSIILALFISLSVWRSIGYDQASIALRRPALFFCAVCQGIVASLQSTHSFPLERALMLRERAAGTYNVSAYFFAKTVSDSFFQLFPTIVFTIIVYPVIGFHKGASRFFMFMLFMILDTLAATSLAVMLSCICVSIEMTTVVMSLCLEITRLFGGYYISPALMEQYKNWQFAEALSFLKYVFVGISINEFSGLEFTCTQKQLKNGICPYVNGEEVMKVFGYDLTSIDFNIGILIVYIVGCRIVAYLALRFIKN